MLLLVGFSLRITGSESLSPKTTIPWQKGEKEEVMVVVGNRMREWATPLTMGAFLLSGVTGMLLFFGIDLPLVNPVHEWLSWLFLIGAAFHMIANWRPSLQYALKPLGRGILIVFFLLTCASVIPFGNEHGKDPAKKVIGALVGASLQVVSQIADHNPEETMAVLRSKGIQATRKEQTVAEIAEDNDIHPMHILDIVFSHTSVDTK
jgi:hypothetical protein